METEIQNKLASLNDAISPETIMEREKARLRNELAQMLRHNGSWLRRFVAWRLCTLRASGASVLEHVRFYVAASFLFRSLQMGCLYYVFFFPTPVFWFGLVGFLMTVFMGFIFRSDPPRKDGDALQSPDYARGFAHFGRTLILPLMVPIRLVDFAITFIQPRFYSPEQIGVLQTALAQLTPAEIVSAYYHRQIAEVQEACLGEASVLRQSQQELQRQLERVGADKLLIDSQMGDAAGDEERLPDLREAMGVLDARENELRVGLGNVDRAVASALAVFASCAMQVARINGRLRDRAVIQHVADNTEAYQRSLERSDAAISQTVEELRERLLSLAAAMSSAPILLPSSDAVQDTRVLFQHVDGMAENLAKME